LPLGSNKPGCTTLRVKIANVSYREITPESWKENGVRSCRFPGMEIAQRFLLDAATFASGAC
jgi:hypothetical protein